MKMIHIFLLLLTGLSFFSCSDNELSPEEQQRKSLEELSGTYMDAQPYAYGNAYGQRIFTFDQGKWTLKFTLGLDPNLTQQVFEFRTEGAYQITAPSPTVDQAFEGAFGEDKKFLTLKTSDPQLSAAFGLASCGLTPNVEKDISVEGCSLWKPVSECPVDYDLIYLDEAGLLYFGVRPPDNNMCSEDKRPTALTPGLSKI